MTKDEERKFLKGLVQKGQVQMSHKAVSEVEACGLEVDEGVRRSSPEEAEEADCVVCVTLSFDQPLIFPDNVKDNCHFCGTLLQHRPTVPKKPIKVCIACAMEHVEQQQ